LLPDLFAPVIVRPAVDISTADTTGEHRKYLEAARHELSSDSRATSPSYVSLSTIMAVVRYLSGIEVG
jgi:hypothetical protein